MPAGRPPFLSVALVSTAALAYEILLMRLFSISQWHHFAWMIISLALLGYGASGTFISLARRGLLPRFNTVYPLNLGLFGIAAIGCYSLAQQIPFNAEEILWDWHQSLYLLAVYLLHALPFFFAANAIALTLTRFPHAVSLTYAADLTGAGLGSAMIIALLFLLLPQTALKAIALAGLLAMLIAAAELRLARRRAWQVTALSGIALLMVLPTQWLEPQISPYKGLSQALRVTGTEIIDTRSSPLGLVSVIASPVIPLRHAPGLSLMSRTPIPEQIGIFTDGDALTTIDRNPGQARLDYLDMQTSALPYYLSTIDQVLVLGAGGGHAVQQAHNHAAPHIDAVELNAQLVELVATDYAAYAGHLYERQGIHIHTGEARGFLTRSTRQYDLIQLGQLDAWSASGAGLYASNESYIYTVEALQTYLQHLTADGYLVLSRWIRLPPRDNLKLLATAIQALRASGIAEPGRHLVLVRGWQTATLLVKRSPLTAVEITRLKSFSQSRSFDLAWFPGMQPDEANRFNILAQPYYFQAAQALLGDDSDRFINDYKFNISPATDNRPYYFNFFRWGVLAEILSLRGQGGMPLLDAGYLVLVATLLQAVVISLLLIVLPLLGLGRDTSTSRPAVSHSRTVLYFFTIGIAFLFIEIAFIQRFILFLHHPLYAVSVVLTAFLLFAGLGSAWTSRQPAGNRRIVLAVSGIALLGTLYLVVLGPLFDLLMPLHISLRIPVSILLIAPLAFCMGMPFPLGLMRLADAGPQLTPWAWGINGCASVLSAVLAALLAIQFGFMTVIVVALLLYIFAAVVFP
ncbi:MAG: SAM-dependent methyltransferase [Pseudomonadota bacterium]